MNNRYKEYRCKKCRKLLIKGVILEGDIEIKCKQCHEMTIVIESSVEEYLCGILQCPGRIPMMRPIAKNN